MDNEEQGKYVVPLSLFEDLYSLSDFISVGVLSFASSKLSRLLPLPSASYDR